MESLEGDDGIAEEVDGSVDAEEAAIREIGETLAERGDGRVWINDWRSRYGGLAATPKEFMEQRPHLFTLTQEGNRFSVQMEGVDLPDPSHRRPPPQARGSHVGPIIPLFQQQSRQQLVPPRSWGGKGKAADLPQPSVKPGLVLGRPVFGSKGFADKGDKGGKGGKGGFAAAPMALAKGGYKGGYKGSASEAIEEIKDMLASNQDGRVWIEDWRDRYGSLARNPKEFMESHPFIFQLNHRGKGYTVSLVDQLPPRESPRRQVFGAPMQRRGPEPPCVSSVEEKAEQALQELRDQLVRRNDGKVWIQDWRERYRELGASPKDFMESHPEHFTLTYVGSKSYTVALADSIVDSADDGLLEDLGIVEEDPTEDLGIVEEEDLSAPVSDSAPAFEGVADDDACIEELTSLIARSRDGRIWVPDWKRRFSHLANNPREFMEARPEVFEITVEGNRFSTALVNPPETIEPVPMGMKRPAGDDFEGWPPAKAMRIEQPTEDLEGLEADALAEVFLQLSRPESTGRIWFEEWRERFGRLARTPKHFLEAHPDKFRLHPGRGNAYTVEALDMLP